MSDEAAIIILQEVRALREQVEGLTSEVSALRQKVRRPDLVKHSVDAAAERMGIGRSSVYREINAGRLDAIKEGRRTFITEEAVQSWERARRRNSH